ncbi:MAG: 50S ribosomal protein L4 [Candidatus Omnitrophica bacterium]|nr:50S ribosomal protein L4 [Candidatus Omnitrophota bacterium]MBI5145360.1 50S ribosomal protein L4 [Candidatus Omnitrophota bacterium]
MPRRSSEKKIENKEPVSLPIYSMEGREVDSLKLEPGIFNGEINTALMHRAVVAYLANQRKGLASTKTMGEVSGGGRKPWRQKGTGRARVGSIRSPLWRHGGVIFGPHPRSFRKEIPVKMRNAALRSALCAKIKEDNFLILDSLKLDAPKTKNLVGILNNLKINFKTYPKQNVLLLLSKLEPNLYLAGRNLKRVSINQAKDTHAYEVLAAQKLIITKEGLTDLTQRLSPVRNFSNRENKISNGVKKR